MKPSLQRWTAAAAVCLLALAVYANSFPGAFIVDDVPIVRDHPLVREPDMLGIFGTDYWGSWAGSKLYRPLLILSFSVNRAIFGPGVHFFHLVNVLLHAAASLLLLLLLRRLPLGPGVAWLAAALFAAHPIHAEVVNTVVGRAESLTAVLVFLGLLAALGRGRLHLPLTALCYSLALLTKESALVFLPLLLCLDAFTAGSLRERLRERRGLYALLAAATVAWLALRTWALGHSHVPPQIVSPSDNPAAGLSALPRLLTAGWMQLLYLRNLAFPRPPLGVYTTSSIGSVDSVLSLRAGAVVAAAALLAFLGARGWRRRRGYALGMALYFAAFLVNLNVFLVTYVAFADRLAYLPSAGFCLAAASLLLAAATPEHPRALRLGARAGAGAFLCLSAWLTLSWNPLFSSSLRLWQHSVEADPRNSRAWLFLAGDLATAGRNEEAEASYRRAIDADPSFPDPHVFYSAFLLDADRAEEALRHAEEALRMETGGFGPVSFIAARANLRLGRPREALRRLDEVRLYYAATPLYQEIRAKTLDALGDAAGAIELYRQVAAHPAGSPGLSLRLAELLIERGEAREAEQVLRTRIGVAGNADLYNLLGVALALQGRSGEAVREFERALALEPGSVLFRENLGNARAEAARRSSGGDALPEKGR